MFSEVFVSLERFGKEASLWGPGRGNGNGEVMDQVRAFLLAEAKMCGDRDPVFALDRKASRLGSVGLGELENDRTPNGFPCSCRVRVLRISEVHSSGDMSCCNEGERGSFSRSTDSLQGSGFETAKGVVNRPRDPTALGRCEPVSNRGRHGSGNGSIADRSGC